MFRYKKGEKIFKDRLKSLIKQKRNSKVKWIIANEDSFDFADSTGTTLLHLAAKYNNDELIKFFIKRGCDVNVRNSLGSTPLMTAVSLCKYEAIDCLLESNADVFITNNEGEYALKMMSNTESYTPRTLKLFLSKVKTSSSNDEDIANKLVQANFPLDLVVYLKNAEVTQLILEKEIQFNDTENYRSILNAVQSLDFDNVDALLSYGLDRQIRLWYFLDLFYQFTKSNDPKHWNLLLPIAKKCVEWKLVHELTIDYYERIYETAQAEPLKAVMDSGLHFAIKETLNYDFWVHVFGNCNVNLPFEILDETDHDVNGRSRNGLTALHLSMKYGIVRNVRYLLEKGANPNTLCEGGLSPLFMALSHKDSPFENESDECVRLLLQYGADAQHRNSNGESFFEFHEVCLENMPVIEVILSHLAMIEALNVPIEKSIYERIELDDLLSDCFKASRKQVQEMKNFQIHGSLTLFAVITKRTEKIVRAVGTQTRESIDAVINSKTMQKLHYYFYGSVRERLESAVYDGHCRNKAAEVIADTFEMLQRNSLIIDEIISYLTWKDLVLFAE